MLIWRGKGILVLVSGFLGGMVAGLVSGLNLPATLSNFLMWLVWGLVSAGINYWFCRRFISTEKRVFIDEQTGQRVEMMDRSSLFFIRNQIWTYIYVIAFGGLGIMQLIG